MTRTTLNVSLTSVTLLIGSLSATMRAAEPESAPLARVPCRTVGTPVVKETFTIYVSSAGCLRTFRKSGTFDNVPAALWAAQQLRKSNKLVWVTTGNPADGGQSLHPSLRVTPKVTGCSVYGRGCSRSEWQVSVKTDTVADAEKQVEELKKDLSQVEVVYHLASR